MNTELLKILALCLISSALALILRKSSAEYSFIISIVAGIVVLTAVINSVTAPVKGLLDKISEYGVNTDHFKTALKAVGIAYITDFIAESCRDEGQSSIASKAMLAGKTAIFLLSVPLVYAVLEAATGFLT